ISELDAGIQPNTIVAAGDPKRMAFTNLLDINRGFGTIEVTNDDPLNFKATIKNAAVSLSLGTNTQHYDLMIRNARGIV
ncbi:hypothetical protein ACC771_25125, partial [Rhizobium ruizarguesonis]